MKNSYLLSLLQMRLLVGFLGERAQFAWWSTSFFGDYSLRYLEFVTPKTARLAQYHGVLEVARKSHDEPIKVGSYHLFRLPEEVEQDLHAMVLNHAVGEEFSQHTLRDKETAMAALHAMATVNHAQPRGGRGSHRGWKHRKAWRCGRVGRHRGGLFFSLSQNTKAYPYLVG